jgi:transposase
MHGQHRKIDPSRIMTLKRRGLSNAQIARRLGVSNGAVYHVLRKTMLDPLCEPAVAQPTDKAQRDGSG